MKPPVCLSLNSCFITAVSSALKLLTGSGSNDSVSYTGRVRIEDKKWISLCTLQMNWWAVRQPLSYALPCKLGKLSICLQDHIVRRPMLLQCMIRRNDSTQGHRPVKSCEGCICSWRFEGL